MHRWIDTHCHLDAPEFAADWQQMRQRALDVGVMHCVLPAVLPVHFDRVVELAHRNSDVYALGIHPLYVQSAPADALQQLEAALQRHAADPRLVAVGEIGLDGFVPSLNTPPMRAVQWHFYTEQLQLAKAAGLPVILHVRKSADLILKGLSQIGGPTQTAECIGIAHAFNGSWQQAQRCVQAGLKLGFGGALTFERATALRQLATTLPLSALVLETDAPDIPPHWVYQTAAQRLAGAAQGRNEPAHLPAIAAVVAQLRQVDLQTLAAANWHNAAQALPKLARLLS